MENRSPLLPRRGRFALLALLPLLYAAAALPAVASPATAHGNLSAAHANSSSDQRQEYRRVEQMAARLEQLRKQVHLLETSMEARRRSHGGSDPASWKESERKRFHRQVLQQRQLKDEHNRLAAVYNQYMIDSGYRFTTPATLPPGARSLPGQFLPFTDVHHFLTS